VSWKKACLWGQTQLSNVDLDLDLDLAPKKQYGHFRTITQLWAGDGHWQDK